MFLKLTGALAGAAMVGCMPGERHAATRRAAGREKSMWCFIGTTGGKPPMQSKGIYVCRFDASSGKLTPPQLAAETRGPSFLTLHPNGKFLYATRETSAGGDAIGAESFAIDRATGMLSSINGQPTGGKGNCFVRLDATARTLLVANYSSGSLATLPVGEDGALRPPASVIQDQGTGPFPNRQEGPHAHSFNPDPSNRFAIGCDLGTDQLLVFKLDPATAKLSANDPPMASVPPGSGPRHLAFGPGARYAYVINELSSTITVFVWDAARGTLRGVQNISTLPADFKAESWAAEVCVSPNGQLLYGSNRGHDSIAIFSIDAQDGTLEPRGHISTGGKWPRHFRIDPTGRWLIAANEHTNDLVVLKIDPDTNQLQPSGERAQVPSPSCVQFLP
jgi:6-phosphogluconolactonase